MAFEIQIGANIDGLSKELNRSLGLVDRWGNQVTSSATKGETAFIKVGGAAERANKQITKTTKASGAASMALIDLGRVAQDAPYGFIGIANNLNPLLESFQRLRAESGSNAGALKALGASLMSGSGLGLALSAVTAAMTFAQVGLSMWTRKTKEAKEANIDYADTLDAVSRVHLKGAQQASKEVVSLKALYTATQNTSLALTERKKAVSELQKQYPEVFSNFRSEDILAGKAAKAYEKLTGSIIAAARARAGQDAIAKNANRELENESKIINLEKERIKLEEDKKKLTKQVEGSGQGAAGIAAMIVGIEKRINDNIREQNNLKADTKKLNQENLRLEEQILKYQQQGGTVAPGSSGKTTGKEKEPTGAARPVVELKAQMVDAAASITQSANAINSTNLIPFSEGIANVLAGIEPHLTETQLRLQDFNANVSYILQSGLVNTLASVSESIGMALANGTSVIDSVGLSLLESLGNVLSQLGRMALETGLTIQAIKTSIQNLQPAPAIAAGIALMAVAGVVKAKAAKMGKSMGSGPVSGGGASFSPGSMPSSYQPSTSYASSNYAGSNTSMGGGVIYLKVSGMDLVAVMNRAGQQLSRYK